MGIDGWPHIEHIKRPWVLSAHIGISTIHIRNPKQIFSKTVIKDTDGWPYIVLHTNQTEGLYRNIGYSCAQPQVIIFANRYPSSCSSFKQQDFAHCTIVIVSS